MSNFESTYTPANFIAGICHSPTVEQVKDLLKHAVEIVERAKKATAFAKSSGALGKAGEKLDEATESLSKYAKRVSGWSGDASAGCEISNAVEVLNKWTTATRTDEGDLEAAKAFDQLFAGAAHFFAKLPAPFNKFAALLEEVGRVSFFANMEQVMRHGQATPGGKPMQDVLDSMDRPN